MISKMKALAGIMTVLFIANMLTPAYALEKPLYADQTIVVGKVEVYIDGTDLVVKYTTAGGWCLNETHLAVAAQLAGIPQTKKGNPIPGKFNYTAEFAPPGPGDPGTLTWEQRIPLTAFPGGTRVVYIAAQAVVQTWAYVDLVWTMTEDETAWALGDRFSISTWGMYFTFTL